jgi:hypothetical protein
MKSSPRTFACVDKYDLGLILVFKNSATFSHYFMVSSIPGA